MNSMIPFFPSIHFACVARVEHKRKKTLYIFMHLFVSMCLCQLVRKQCHLLCRRLLYHDHRLWCVHSRFVLLKPLISIFYVNSLWFMMRQKYVDFSFMNIELNASDLVCDQCFFLNTNQENCFYKNRIDKVENSR